MTDTVELALIALVGAVIAAVPPSIIAWRAGTKAQIAIDKTDEGNQRIQSLAINVDGRLTQLLAGKDAKNAATAISSHAEGVLEEKTRQENL